jgi:hypothetical protein
MNSELIEAWEKIVGHDKINIISNKFFDSRLDMEFPQLHRGSYEHKKMSIRSELENNANMLIEFERNGFLTHEEVSRMIEISTLNIISNKMPEALFENVSLMIDDEILKKIKNKLNEIERKGFLAHNEVSAILKELTRNIKVKTTQGALFKYVCIMMDDEGFKEEREIGGLEMLIRYIRWSLESLKNEEKMLE